MAGYFTLLYLPCWFIVLKIHSGQVYCKTSGISGPIFIKAPRPKVEFLSSDGVILDCYTHGDPLPEIKWFRVNGNNQQEHVEVHSIPSLIHLFRNGSLGILPFIADRYDTNIHATVYICSANNKHGRIVSPSVSVRATIREQQKQLQAQVYDAYVIAGNTAVLKCHIPAFFKDDLEVIAWIREDNTVINVGQNDQKYVITKNGNLHIFEVSSKSETEQEYWCRVRNKMTGDTFLSRTAGRIKLTDPQGGTAPKITDILQEAAVKIGETLTLACASQGYPAPTYRWLNGSSVLSRNSTLIIKNTNFAGTFLYTCISENRFGSEKAESRVVVREKLQNFIQPELQVVNSGGIIEMQCKIKGHPIENIHWKFNGNFLEKDARVFQVSEESIRITPARRKDEGMYQCFSSNRWDVVQAAAQVLLGDVAPQFISTFTGKKMQPGPSISLKCVSTGRPDPEMTWIQNGKKLKSNNKFIFSEKKGQNGAITSKLIVKNLRTKDGGSYSCIAENKVDKVVFTERITVYGLPYIHDIDNVTVAAGQNATLNCYVSGHPIKFMKWARDDSLADFRGKDYENGSLFIADVKDEEDEGWYTCSASNGKGQEDKKSTYLNVMNKPSIMQKIKRLEIKYGGPFSTMCSVLSGDEPVKISWLKDGNEIKLRKGTDVSTTKMYSVLQIRKVQKEHTGNYTCVAENKVGKDLKTVALTILYSPEWVKEPSNKYAELGGTIQFHCLANGSPVPKYKWWRFTGEDFKILKTQGLNHRILENGTLEIKKIETSDATKYICRAINGVNPKLRKEVLLQIAGDKPNLLYLNESSDLSTSNDFKLICKVAGEFPIKILWMHDDKVLFSNNQQKISQERYQNQHVISVLSVGDRFSDTSGQYTCIAENKYGKKRWDLLISLKHEDEDKVGNIPNQSTIHPEIEEENMSKMTVSNAAMFTESHLVNQMDASSPIKDNKHDKEESRTYDSDIRNSERKIRQTSGFMDEFMNMNVVIYGIPAFIVIFLLIAVIIALAMYLVLKKKNSKTKRELLRLSEMNIKENYYKDKSMSVNNTLNRRYGKLDKHETMSNQGSHTIRTSGYEIPDYYAEMKPYDTLQLSSRHQSQLNEDHRDSQVSV